MSDIADCMVIIEENSSLLTTERLRVEVLHEDHLGKEIALRKEDGTYEICYYEKVPKPDDRNLSFSTMDSFIAYVNSQESEKENSIVFLDKVSVMAHFHHYPLDDSPIPYHHTVKNCASLQIEYAEEFESMRYLSREPHTQKVFWRWLIISLSEEISGQLALEVGAAKFKKTEGKALTVDVSGVESSKATKVIQVSYGETLAKIGLDWVYVGRVFECSDYKVEMPLRLEVSVDEKSGELLFQLHAIGMERARRDARAELVKELREKITLCKVYEGSL